MSWHIELGQTDRDTKIFHNDQYIGYIQNFSLSCNVGEPPKLTLTIRDPDMKVKGMINSADVKMMQKCPQCGEEERITNKGW